ncbi:MAG: FecR family protein, partial [Planctomycetota bacterium]
MNNFEKPYKMTCEEAQLLMVPMWAKMLGITSKEKMAFNVHVIVCPACSKEYKETKELMPLVKKHWGPVSIETRQLLERAGHKVLEQKHISTNRSQPMTVEEGWKDLCRRCPDLAEKPKSLQLFLRIGAVAACLVVGILTWMVFSNYSKPQTLPQDSSSQQVASAPKPSVKVELVTDTGNIPIPSDQQITSADQLKTLLINDKHKMRMNTNTVLAVEPLVEHSNIGCLVKLTSGQIYTHVRHDGNPFVVDTAYGEAVITGTTFDIKATDTSVTLVVSEGTVQFESENGVVNITAGQTSEIVGQSAPSNPILCNADELTAWATGYKLEAILTQVKSNTDPWEPPLSSLKRDPIVLNETDYDRWVEWERDWFKQEFPQVFQLKDALAKKGIEVDYPELLIKTGDVWQFVCLEVSPAQFSVINPDSLLKTASNYGFGKQWLLGNVPAAKSALEKPVLSENSFTGLKAFERWLDYFDETKGLTPPTPIYSFHASKYLANTRSL